MWLLTTDEDNWRNDYPDEEDLFQSDSDDEGQHSRAAYRYHDSYGKLLADTMIPVLQSRGKKEPSEMGSQIESG